MMINIVIRKFTQFHILIVTFMYIIESLLSKGTNQCNMRKDLHSIDGSAVAMTIWLLHTHFLEAVLPANSQHSFK